MITAGFFNSIGGDRRYRAENFADFFNSIISTGVFEDTIGNLIVSPSGGMSASVAPGKAFINGYCMISDSAISFSIPAAHASLDRIDRIVVRLDLAGRAIDIVLLGGTPSGTPTPPELTRNSSRYELCLAQISIPAGTTEMTSALITDTRPDANLCGGVYVRTANEIILAGKADKNVVDDILSGNTEVNAGAIKGTEISDTPALERQVLKLSQGVWTPVYTYTAGAGVTAPWSSSVTYNYEVNLGSSPSKLSISIDFTGVWSGAGIITVDVYPGTPGMFGLLPTQPAKQGVVTITDNGFRITTTESTSVIGSKTYTYTAQA